MIASRNRALVRPGTEPLVGAAEAAAYLGRPVSWLYDRWRSLGIPAYRVGARLSFRLSELDEWLDAQRVPSTGTARR